MNDQATIAHFAAAVEPLQRVVTFKAWRLRERESYPAKLLSPASFDEARDQALALTGWNAKDTMAVLREDAGRNKRTLRLYQIKRSTKRYSYRAATDGGRPVRVGALEATLISEAQVHAFEPVEPFDAFRDDPVGRDLTLVER